MGCTENKPSLRAEEVPLVEAQTHLGFTAVPIARIDKIIRKHSFSRRINESQLNAIALELGCVIDNTQECRHIRDAYNMLKDSQGFYKTNLYLILGIICGQGLLAEKSALLFEVYDEGMEGKMDDRTLSAFLNDWFFVMLNVLGALVSAELKEWACDNYLTTCQESVPRVKEYFKRCIKTADVLTRETFVNNLASMDDGRMLVPHELRAFLYSEQVKKESLQSKAREVHHKLKDSMI